MSGQQNRYFVLKATDGPMLRWNVVDRTTQEWVRRFATEKEAQDHASRRNADDIRVAVNKDMYGHCSSIVAYRGHQEIGRASRGSYPRPNWLIGPSNIPNADDFDIELEIKPDWTDGQMLAKVEMLLLMTISAAEAGSRRAA